MHDGVLALRDGGAWQLHDDDPLDVLASMQRVRHEAARAARLEEHAHEHLTVLAVVRVKGPMAEGVLALDVAWLPAEQL